MEFTCLSLHHFACKANRVSESGFENTLGLVLMPQIQWHSHIRETTSFEITFFDVGPIVSIYVKLQ